MATQKKFVVKNGLIASNLSYPTTDGTAGQTFVTDGAGNITIATPALNDGNIFIGNSSNISSTTTLDTSIVPENTNLYYTTARGDSDTGVYIAGNRTYGNITTTGYIAGPATMTIDPAAVGDNTGTLVIAGNLQVDGTTTTINSTTLEVEDKNVVLGPNAANDAANNGAGLTVTQPDTSNATLIYDTTSTQWEFNKALSVPSINTTGDITFGDNDKAIFGAGSDLQIYHDGSHSYLLDNGTGNLRINTDNQVQIRKHNNEAIAYFNADGAVQLYHDGTPKFATTATGIDVTGTITADGLTVETATGTATPTPSQITISTSSNASDWSVTDPWGRLAFYSADASSGGAKEQVALDVVATTAAGGVSDFIVKTYNSSLKNRMRVAYTGDISFYEDTGTTAKFFWDSSAESLGIGTTSPGRDLHINGTAANAKAFTRYTHDGLASTGLDVGYSSGGYASIYNAENTAMVFSTNSDEKMRIDSSGNVGIGGVSSNPASFATALELHGTTNSGMYLWDDTAGRYGYLLYDGNNFNISAQNAAGTLVFKTADTERMTITSAGLVGIGVVPEAWSALYGTKALQVGAQASLSDINGDLHLTSNAYYDTTNARWEYINADYATKYTQIDGVHQWLTAGSGTADGAVTFTQAMALDAAASWFVGNTVPRTASQYSTQGGASWYQPDQHFEISTTSNVPALEVGKNNANDGSLITFRKQSNVVGSIGTAGGNLIVEGNTATGKTGIKFGGAEWIPQDNGNSDGGVSLGLSTVRFKDLYLSNAVVQSGVKQTTTATTQVTIETFPHGSYDGAKVVITAATSADTYVTELLIATNGTTAVATEYGQIGTGSALATYDVDVSGTDVRIQATPASATSTAFKVAMTLT